MYDWNASETSKNEYILNRTHWIEFGQETPICGGDQNLPTAIGYDGTPTYLYYTEYQGSMWIPNVNTAPMNLPGPSYIEMSLEHLPDGSNEAHYHVTQVFAHTQSVSSWGPNPYFSKNLLDLAYDSENQMTAANIYYSSSHPGVHIKKVKGLFENEGQFIEYCSEQFKGLSAAQIKAKAKEILDTYAYKIAGGWVYTTYDNTSNQNSKIYTYIMNPNNTYRTYYGVKDVEKQYSEAKTSFTGPNTRMADGTTTGKSEYGNTVKHGYIMVPVAPEEDWVTDSSVLNEKKYGTWGDIGESGLYYYVPETYHPLDIHYLPQEIQQMMEDMSKFLLATAPEPALG